MIATKDILAFINEGEKIYKNREAKEKIDGVLILLNTFIKHIEDIYGTPCYTTNNQETKYSIQNVIKSNENFHLGFDADEELSGFVL